MILFEEEKIFFKKITPKAVIWVIYLFPFFTGWFIPEHRGLFFSEVAIKALAMSSYIVLGALLACLMTSEENRTIYFQRGIGLSLFTLCLTPFIYFDRIRDWIVYPNLFF